MTNFIEAHMANGQTIKTDFNGGPAAAISYYVGKQFNLGAEDDAMTYCHKVEVDGIEYNHTTHSDISERAHEKNLDLIAVIESNFNKHEGPRVGDVLRLSDGGFKRFTHDWGDSIQTTDYTGKDASGGSFCIHKGGTASYSGGLQPSINKTKLRDTGEKMPGRFWMFSENYATAHNAVHFMLGCRVHEAQA